MSHRVESLRQRIAARRTGDFDALALEVFAYQRAANPTYRRYLELSGLADQTPSRWSEIPCLPIELFRGHEVRSGDWTPELNFRSSGTSGAQTSTMPVRNLTVYRRGCLETFRNHVGQPEAFVILALLPGYLERGDSGLVAMVADFVARAAPGSGFYLDDLDGLRDAVAKARSDGRRVLLWGVTFALLRLAEQGPPVLPEGSIVMETGGMKGHGPELTRPQLHKALVKSYEAPVYSEYGMTELSSQAYLTDGSRFRPATSMRVSARDLTDPFSLLAPGRQGALNVYDLANLDTCAFVQTDDLARVYEDGSFDVLGRVDRSVARGCNLLLSEV